MSARPPWVLALHLFVVDEIIAEKYGYPMDGEDDDIHEAVEEAVNRVLCGHYGHEIINDHCGVPEHRYCVWCGRADIAIRGETS